MTIGKVADPSAAHAAPTRRVRLNAALREALSEEMERDPTVCVIGEDVGVYGGLYKVTDGLLAKYGPRRVFDTPISEGGFLGAAVGMAMVGLRPVVEIMYADFLGVAMDPIVSQIATIPYVWNSDLPIVVRIQGGTGGSSPHHGKTLEAWLCHLPDTVVIYPSTAQDYKGLLKSAIRDRRPVLFCESRHIYERFGEVPSGECVEEIGEAAVRQEGTDITVASWGRMMTRVLEATEALQGRVSVEAVDLRTLVPLDMDTLQHSVEKTGRLLVVQEAWKKMGFGAEVVARIAETCGQNLRSAPSRLGAVNHPQPFSPVFLDAAIPTVGTIQAEIERMTASL